MQNEKQNKKQKQGKMKTKFSLITNELLIITFYCSCPRLELDAKYQNILVLENHRCVI